MTLLAVFQTLLYRYTGEKDIVIGTPIANRNRAEIEELIGFFVNTLVMRTKLRGEESFRELLQRVREVVLDAYSHQDLPFEKLVEELEPVRDLSRSPLFQVLFVLQNAPRARLELPGLTLSPLAAGNKTAKFDLTLFVTEGRGGLLLSLEYNTDLFEAATVERMLEHFQVLLEAVVQEPAAQLGRLPLLTRVEQQWLAEWNETRSEYPRERCIHELFTEQAERTPDNVALVCAGEALTYRELNERANQLAHYLRRNGIGAETLVGVCLERSIEMVTALLAILKAGGAYVPLDPQYPQSRLAYILEEAETSIVLTQEHLSKNLPGSQSETFCYLDSAWAQLAEYPTSNPCSEVTPANLAYVIYTSGSTGHPKGVQIEHESAMALIDWAQGTFPAESFKGVLASTSICFDLSVFELFVPLSVGGTIVLAQNALQLPELESRVAVTLINTVPSAMSELVRMGAVPASVRVVNLAGEALSARLAQEVYGLEQVESLYNLYGPSEDTTYSTWELVARSEQANVPIGRPVSNTRAYVVDEGLQLVPVGVSGELLLGGEGLSRGYLKRAELTAARFIPDPFSGQAGERLYRTGDLCRYKVDGRLEYLGRLDHQVKVRGYRIELGEIETVLSAHEQVSEAVVIAGEENGEKRLVAYVVGAAEPAELRRYLQQRLPEYMIPSAWMKLEALPLTTNGKVDRRALLSPGATTGLEDEDTYVAPRTATEAGLTSIWSEVLKIDRIGIHDNFFALGGHSLLATQVIARVRSVYNVDVPLRRLFESPTVAGFAVAVVQEQASEVAEDEMAQLIAELDYLSDDDSFSQVSS
jgi:amino acid adenylation domain-containing protein